MGLMALTAESLGRQVGEPVPPAYVIIAKHQALGMDDESIRDVLGCELKDITEVKADALYEKVRLIVSATHAQSLVDQTQGWDHLEQLYLSRLIERAPLERDPEFMLRVAAFANKAQRRVAANNGHTLDPAERNGRAAITLSSRLIRKIQNGVESIEQIETRQLSISDGSMQNPSFAEVDSLLSVSNRNLPKPVDIHTQIAEPGVDELTSDLEERFG